MEEKKETSKGQQTQRTDLTVREAINGAIQRKRITQEQGNEIFWLHGYGMSHNLTNEELAKELGKYDKSTISLIFSGNYTAQDWTPVVRVIEALHRRITNEVNNSVEGLVAADIAESLCTSGADFGELALGHLGKLLPLALFA
mgnify:CR=1 FL=1